VSGGVVVVEKNEWRHFGIIGVRVFTLFRKPIGG